MLAAPVVDHASGPDLSDERWVDGEFSQALHVQQVVRRIGAGMIERHKSRIGRLGES